MARRAAARGGAGQPSGARGGFCELECFGGRIWWPKFFKLILYGGYKQKLRVGESKVQTAFDLYY